MRGGGAFTDCSALERVVTLSNSVDVADDALAGCSGVSIYAPYNEDGDYPWSVGVPASGNHILPYGLALASEPLSLEVGQSTDLFEGGLCEVPEGCELSYSYAATPISVDAGQVTGKKAGTSEVTAVLTLGTIELARATRTVEVTEATVEAEEPTEPEASANGADAVADASDVEQPQINEERLLSSDAGIAPMSLDGEFSHISYATTLATSETVSFTSPAPTGQLLQYTVLADDPSAVEVAAAEEGAVSGHLVIPATVQDENQNTYTVRRVAAKAFNKCALIRSASFAQGSQVESIGDNAFSDCQAMESCALPQSLKTIGKQAFYVCYSLKTIEFPDSVTELGNQVLALCTSLTSVTFGKGITKLPNVVFVQGESLSTLHVRGSIDTFGILFQVVDKSAVTVYVPSTKDKQAWESANLGLDPEKIVVGGDVVHTVTFDSNGGASGTFALTVGSGLPVAEPSVGKEGSGLEGWYTEAGERWDFAAGVTGDMRLQARWVEDVQDGDLVFRMRSDGASLVVFAKDPATVKGDVVIPGSHTLGGAEYPVAEIGNAAFYEAKGLTSVDVPASVKSIGTKAFGFCTSMTSVRFSGEPTLESIGTDCFYKCALDGVTLPRSLKRLHRDAFSYSSVKSVVFEEGIGITSLPSMCFARCENLETIVVPDGVRQVGQYVFTGCGLLTSVSLPEGLQNIGERMFEGCPSLGSIAIPSTVTSMGGGAFYACPKLSVVHAQGSLKNTGASAAFDSTVKASATVVLPTTAQDGTGDDFQTMKAAWKGYGFDETRIIQSSGALPLESDPAGTPNSDPTKAGWSLDADGNLKVWSTEKLKDFKWRLESEFLGQYWGPVRNLVRSVDTTGVHSAYSLWAWFRNMPNLVDISKFKVPDGTVEVADVFTLDTALTEVPAIAFPNSVENLRACFNLCSSITKISEDFRLPPNVTNIMHIFSQNRSLKKLPDALVLPDTVTEATEAFLNCVLLDHLPEGLIGSGSSLVTTTGMFRNCRSLAALPQAFVLPSSVTMTNRMFENCTSLVSLPDSFSLPSSCNTTDMFVIAQSLIPGGKDLPMYYAGSGLPGYDWTASHRTLIVPGNMPAGTKAVTLNIKTADESGEGFFWTMVYTDASGMLAEPAYTPSRPGMVFTLWYSDPDCTQRVDFSQAFEADATIYGKLAPGSLGGELPTVAGTGSAFWSLADDGTLYIRGGGTVADLGFDYHNYDNTIPTEGYWSPQRASVRKVSMQLGMKAQTTREWFSGMTALVDTSEVYVPAGVVNASKMFCGATSLTALPEGFRLPDGIQFAMRMFAETDSLATLPAGFVLRDSLLDVNAMFTASGLRTLPESLGFPKNATSARYLFAECSELVSLPSSFIVPADAVADLSELLRGCVNLATLPEGFTIPSSLKSAVAGTSPVSGMLRNCPNLTSLPSGFDVPEAFLEKADPFLCDISEGSPRVATYYAGQSKAVLNYDWASQNRVLISEPADRNKFAVTFKVANDDGTWAVRTKTLTNDAGLAPDLGTISREGYGFTGWCADEDCLVPFDFSKPLDSDREIYGKWLIAGGRNKAQGEEGWLPVESPDGSPATEGMSAWWFVASDGTLGIGCENGASIASFGWAGHFTADMTADHWGAYRDQIKRIVMAESVQARDMACWFRGTPITDISSGFFVPNNCLSTECLFQNAVYLEVLPRILPLPDEIESIGGLFQGCSSLSKLPADFKIPGKVTTTHHMFFRTAIESLPDGFTIPDNVVSANCMFQGCTNLRSLPEGFTLSKRLEQCEDMFSGCTSLTYLPKSLDLTAVANSTARNYLKQAFKVNVSPNLKTYYAGDDPSKVTLFDTFWSDQGRDLVMDKPDGNAFVTFMVPNDASGGKYVEWTSIMVQTPCKANTLAAMVGPDHALSSFVGWYTEEACENEFVFSDAAEITSNLTLYAKYSNRKGDLPTTDGQRNASWELTDDGTLTISCQEGQVIADLGWNWDFAKEGTGVDYWTNYWGPLRSYVKRVEMQKTVRVEGSMDCWFGEMTNLVDASGVFVPEGATSLEGMFGLCESLEILADDLAIPEGVTNARNIFRNCFNLAAVPETFLIPDSATNVRGLFDGCHSLKRLPNGFTVPENATAASGLVAHCFALEELPDGFSLPENVDATSMFYEDSSLRSLPANFRLPQAIQSVRFMFYGCSALKSLPAGFTINEITGGGIDGEYVGESSSMFARCTSLESLPEGFHFATNATSIIWMFSDCPNLRSLPASIDMSSFTQEETRNAFTSVTGKDKGAPVITYYAGDASKLLPRDAGSVTPSQYWTDQFNRTLYAESGTDPLPANTYKVTFQLTTTEETVPTTWMTVLTDASSKVADPGTPSKFGYAFSGWKTEEGTAFDFANDVVAGDTVLYGTYTMITEYEVPLKAKVSVDAMGKVTPAVVQMRSFTPAPLKVSSIWCDFEKAATDVLDQATLNRTAVTVSMPLGANLQLLNDESGVMPGKATLPAATSSATPGVLEYSLGLSLPDDALIKFWGDGWTTPVAKLTYTVGPAS